MKTAKIGTTPHRRKRRRLTKLDPARRDKAPESPAVEPLPMTPEQEHWLATQAKAQVLACRTGSCGE